MEYELRTINDSRKSFYNKALVISDGNVLRLKSYSTIVCEIINGKPVVYGSYSVTTLRHIKEFLLQNGFKAENKYQILKDYAPEEESPKEEKDSLLKSVGMVALMGDLFCNNQKDKNDWKARMLKAGLENRGLIMPEDWDTLTEAEKEKRLNGVIKIIRK